MSKEKYLNTKYKSKQGYTLKVISYRKYKDCDVLIEESNVVVKNTSMKYVKKGSISNPFHRGLFERGFVGKGLYKSTTHKPFYSIWESIFIRCYSKNNYKKAPSYRYCELDEQWYNFQNFAKWCDDNYVKGWQIDKDILIKNNKTYSPETCCFVPHEINSLFTSCKKVRGDFPIGVRKSNKKYQAICRINKKSTVLGTFNTPEEAFQAYKAAKEEYIKEVADKWKGKIDDRVYEAMYNWEIEITD